MTCTPHARGNALDQSARNVCVSSPSNDVHSYMFPRSCIDKDEIRQRPGFRCVQFNASQARVHAGAGTCTGLGGAAGQVRGERVIMLRDVSRRRAIRCTRRLNGSASRRRRGGLLRLYVRCTQNQALSDVRAPLSPVRWGSRDGGAYLSAQSDKLFTTKLSRTPLGTGLARTGTNTLTDKKQDQIARHSEGVRGGNKYIKNVHLYCEMGKQEQIPARAIFVQGSLS